MMVRIKIALDTEDDRRAKRRAAERTIVARRGRGEKAPTASGRCGPQRGGFNDLVRARPPPAEPRPPYPQKTYSMGLKVDVWHQHRRGTRTYWTPNEDWVSAARARTTGIRAPCWSTPDLLLYATDSRFARHAAAPNGSRRSSTAAHRVDLPWRASAPCLAPRHRPRDRSTTRWGSRAPPGGRSPVARPPPVAWVAGAGPGYAELLGGLIERTRSPASWSRRDLARSRSSRPSTVYSRAPTSPASRGSMAKPARMIAASAGSP